MLILLQAGLSDLLDDVVGSIDRTKNDWKEGCYKNYVRINVKNLKCRKSRSKDSSVVQILHGYNDTFIDYIAYSDEYYQEKNGK